MVNPNVGALRVARGSILAATSAALSVLGHVIGGGDIPTGLGVWPQILLLGTAGIALAGRQHSLIGIGTALGTAQVALHFTLTSGHGHGLDPRMVVGHVLAAALTCVLLRRAERILFAMAAALRMLLPKRLAPPPVTSRPLWVAATHRGWSLGENECHLTHPQRGPPVSFSR
ncbi:hypothetical protein D5S17_24935 [Pseudonocardiaceae bacterium YIM PH 21723]|nr:hypothetical protein D5S17_24935 [Pseudonocardiaceae bacterium YIM PH 21723]